MADLTLEILLALTAVGLAYVAVAAIYFDTSEERVPETFLNLERRADQPASPRRFDL